MKLEYKVVILSVMVGVLFILAEMFSRLLSSGPETRSTAEALTFLFEPLTTDQGLFFNLVILLLCFVFGILLARLISQVLKAKDVARQKDIEKNMILEFVPEIVIYINNDYRIKWASRSLYTETGMTESEVVGQIIDNTTGKLFSQEQVNAYLDEFKINKTIDVEIQSRKGKYWQVLSNTAKDENGNVTGYVLLAIDITENKRDEEMKRRSYEQLESNIEQFATVIDNIRNPLSGIVLLSEMSADQKTAGQVVEQCDEIEEVISKLDEGWAKSEDIRDFLKKHL